MRKEELLTSVDYPGGFCEPHEGLMVSLCKTVHVSQISQV